MRSWSIGMQMWLVAIAVLAVRVGTLLWQYRGPLCGLARDLTR